MSTPPSKPTPDMDTQMLFGCSGFVAASIGVYLLAVWPHLVFRDTHLVQQLFMAGGIGCTMATLFGVFVTRRFGLAAGAGFLGGAITSALFLFLRLEQVLSLRGIPDAPQPEYPDLWKWLVPGGWVIFALIAILFSLDREELSIKER